MSKRKQITNIEGVGWRELPRAGVIVEAGNAAKYNTGDWRSVKPVWKEDNCIHCLFCWVFCPDAAILTEDGKMTGIDFDHCKGCGICAKECPAKEKALVMVDDSASQ